MKDTQYAIRDAAFEEFYAKAGFEPTRIARNIMREAFNAGWMARKRAAYMVAPYGGNPLQIGTEPEDDWMKK